MENNLIWLVKLLLAHFISDFILQKGSWVKDRADKKIKSFYLYLHILITGLVALMFIGPKYWGTVLFIMVTHYATDLAKSYLPQNFQYFILDQLAHVAIIFAAWAYGFDMFPSWEELLDFYYFNNFWIVAACVIFLTHPSGFIIARATKFWSDQIINSQGGSQSQAQVAPVNINQAPIAATNNSGLVNAGKYIGIVERLIICLLVYQGQYEAIGLLVTGKSILRYNSANEEIKTEYLLVGTLISIFIAFGVGLLLKFLVPSL